MWNFFKRPAGIAFTATIVAALLLTGITVWQPSNFVYQQDTRDLAENKSALEDQQYRELLASLKPEYKQSREFLEKVITPELVKKEVETALDVKQRVVIPQIADNSINVSSASDQTAVNAYFTTVGSMMKNYQRDVQDQLNSVFVNAGFDIFVDPATAKQLASVSTSNLANNLKTVTVPKPAVAYHKASLVAFDQYSKFLARGEQYSSGNNSQPWPGVYGDYRVIDSQLTEVQRQYALLDEKYNVGQLAIAPASSDSLLTQWIPIKTANAQFGVTVVADIQRTATEALKVGLARGFASFTINMIDKIIGQIEKTFTITSQLYYGDALRREYTEQQLQKFVPDETDRTIISYFLPQTFCVPKSKDELRNIFVAKAKENLANQNLKLDPSSPNYFQEVAEAVGNLGNYPSYQEDLYAAMAADADRAARDAANVERLDSSGLKSSRDTSTDSVRGPGVPSPTDQSGRASISRAIVKASSSVFAVTEAQYNGVLNLGTGNPDSIVGSLVQSTIGNLLNKFVFLPLNSATGNGGVGVLPESPICLSVPQYKPVVPIDDQTILKPATDPGF